MNEHTVERLKELRDSIVNTEAYRSSSLYVKPLFGMHIIKGYFIDANGDKHRHTWNHDPDTDEYVDLMAVDFNPDLPEVLILPADSDEAKRMYEAIRSSENWLAWNVPSETS